ncbi:Sec-independent protein translocase protein TatB [Paracoccus pacificus]|uniref:Sec-independent protein translocase protein TatB n=1 Tax=Paracoccus pacificus TaxID=1463598 RepID=A0ABW4RA13_9RHOB
MLDLGWSELLLIGVVALIVIGPKDLPHLFRSLGRIVAKARSMAREFSAAMEDAAKSSGIEDATKTIKDVKSLTSKKSLGLDALDRATERFEKWDPKIPTANAGAKPDPGSSGPESHPASAESPAAATSVASAQGASAPASTPARTPAASTGAGSGEPGASKRRIHAVRRRDREDD